jgi:hypothetical protein
MHGKLLEILFFATSAINKVSCLVTNGMEVFMVSVMARFHAFPDFEGVVFAHCFEVVSIALYFGE